MNRIVTRLILVLAATAFAAGSARAQCQTAKITASNSSMEDWFGAAVAVDGDWALVGAPLRDDGAFQAGAVYVFHRQGGAWLQTQQLLASDAALGDQFGSALAIRGDQAVIGAIDDVTTGGMHTGSAYAFERVGSTWIERAKLVANDGADQDVFGGDVAITQDRIVVGAWAAAPFGLFSGKAYVFELSGGLWLQVAGLTPNDAAPGQQFGSSVTIDGDRLVIGAPRVQVSPTSVPGAAYVFERNALGQWQQQQKLLAANGVTQDLFGSSVSISGGTLAVGAPSRDVSAPNSGSCYFYDVSGTTWAHTQEVQPADVAQDDFSGTAVLRGDVALIPTADDDAGIFNVGAVYEFRRRLGIWSQTAKASPNTPLSDTFFGNCSLAGDFALVGALGVDDVCPQVVSCDSGAAYVFHLADSAAQYGHCSSGAPCGNSDSFGGCVNSTGQGAVLLACASGSLAVDSLRFEARNLPLGTFGLLFMGGAQANTPFGNGRLVVSSGSQGLYRLIVQQADAQGVFAHGPGILALAQTVVAATPITPGQTWFFQLWYRDNGGPCGSSFNFTNGLSVEFSP